MSAYRIELRPAAARALRTLDPQIRRRIQGAIALLAHDPRPPGACALQGRPGLHVRVGDYRIVYRVADDRLIVVVVRLGHRRDIYLQSRRVQAQNVTEETRSTQLVQPDCEYET